MPKTNRRQLPWQWLLLTGALVLVAFVLVKRPSQPIPSSSYVTYRDPHGFSIDYPSAWEIRPDTQVFEHGDAISFRSKGPTQKDRTELTDGAQMALAKPFTSNTDLATWVKNNFNNQAEISRATLGTYTFTTVDDCANLDCMKYYFTMVNDQVYGIAIFVAGTAVEKAAYENTLLTMIKSLQFVSATAGNITTEEALARVRSLPEVRAYLQRVPQGSVAISGEETDSYLVQVYEFKDNHTATFSWYRIDKTTGTVKVEF